jgi:hypothetical protein
MKKSPKGSRSLKTKTAEGIARLADRGEDISGYFSGPGRMMKPGQSIRSDLTELPIQRVNVDLTAAMLEELDQAAQRLNVSRQAVIKTLVRQALDDHYLAMRARQSAQ